MHGSKPEEYPRNFRDEKHLHGVSLGLTGVDPLPHPDVQPGSFISKGHTPQVHSLWLLASQTESQPLLFALSGSSFPWDCKHRSTSQVCFRYQKDPSFRWFRCGSKALQSSLGNWMQKHCRPATFLVLDVKSQAQRPKHILRKSRLNLHKPSK